MKERNWHVRIEERVALVTGSSRGIGKAITLAPAQAGAVVAVNYRERVDGKETAMTIKQPSVHGATESAPAASEDRPTFWPDTYDLGLARTLIDSRMLAFYDEQPARAVNDFQHRHLQALLRHLLQHSPWWRERICRARTGVSVEFSELPLMSRTDFRDFLVESGGPLPVPSEHGATETNETSGSSGIPLRFYYSHRVGSLNLAHSHYELIRQGVDHRHIIGNISRSKVTSDDVSHITQPALPLLRRAERLLRGSSPYTVEQHARWVADVQPTHLIGHAGLLMGIVDAFDDGIVAVPGRPVQALFSFAESITPAFRAQVRRVLGARVIDRYSCEEVGPMAYQCPVSDDHLHIALTNAVVEILDETGSRSPPGRLGRVYVTGLHNLASPVVRYELGDLAAWEPRCVCGYDKPVLSRLEGRVRFLVRLPSGERKHVRVPVKRWISIAPFVETRIVQVSIGVIRAECVLDRSLSADERRAVIKMLRHEISPDLNYEVVQVDRIDWGPTYKRQDVTSLV